MGESPVGPLPTQGCGNMWKETAGSNMLVHSPVWQGLPRSSRSMEPHNSRKPTPPPLPQHPTFGAPTACEWASCSWSSATLKSSSSTGNPAVQKSLSTSSFSPPGKLAKKEKGRTQALPYSWHYHAGCSPCPPPPPALLPLLPQGLDAGTSSPAAVGQQGTEISQHKTL